MEIRAAVTADAKALAGLLGQLGYPAARREVERRLEAFGASADDRLLVVEVDGRVVALASLHVRPLFHLDGRWCRVSAFVVDERHRRRGVGRELVRAIEQYARSRGCVAVELTSGKHRADAHAFYGRVGFEEQDRYQFLKWL